MIVLDANILIRAVLGRRVRQLIETNAGQSARFFAPDVAFQDDQNDLPLLLKKRGLPHVAVSSALEYLRHVIDRAEQEGYGVFEDQARQRLHGRNENDWPVLPSALGTGFLVWIEDAGFFGTGLAIWTTNRVEIFLKAQAKCVESRED